MNKKTLDLITQINLLCIDISTTTKHDAHFKYSGHANLLNVNVDEGGFNADIDSVNLINAYLDDPNLAAKLQAVINKLGEYLV